MPVSLYLCLSLLKLSFYLPLIYLILSPIMPLQFQEVQKEGGGGGGGGGGGRVPDVHCVFHSNLILFSFFTFA
jgi:hypothetical protein